MRNKKPTEQFDSKHPSKKKIAVILPNLNSGGAERVTINYLQQLDLTKYDISLIVFRKTSDLLPLIPKDVNIISLDSRSTINSFWPLLKKLSQIKPHVVFTTHSRTATLLIPIKLFNRKFRHIARMQNMPSLEKAYNAYSNISRWLYGWGFKSSDTVIAQTEEMRQDAVSIFGVSAKKVEVLHNPIDKMHIQLSLQGSNTPFPPGQISAVTSGRLTYQKGFDILLSALPEIINCYPNFMLYILGEDKGEKHKLKKLTETLSLQNHVVFSGFQPNPYPYYRYCDLFISASRWEGFPNAVLENHFLNTPIVSTCCVPVLHDLIQDGVNGYLCETGDIKNLSRAILKGLKLRRATIQNTGLNAKSLDVLL